jgi:hypothetical protein
MIFHGAAVIFTPPARPAWDIVLSTCGGALRSSNAFDLSVRRAGRDKCQGKRFFKIQDIGR